jgi:hypothetical protein
MCRQSGELIVSAAFLYNEYDGLARIAGGFGGALRAIASAASSAAVYGVAFPLTAMVRQTAVSTAAG